MTITALLDNLYELRQAAKAVQAKIEAAAPELVAERSRLETEVKQAEKAIDEKSKYISKSQAHTMIGQWLQLVWSQPKPKLDDSKVEHLVARYNAVLASVRQVNPELAAELQAEFGCASLDSVKTEPDGYWSKRERGKK